MAASRFATWPQALARLLLAAVAALLVLSAIVPIEAAPSPYDVTGFVESVGADGIARPQAERPRDADLSVYDQAVARIANGENYYDFIVSEHRKARFPVVPGFAVRLPTLPYIAAIIGPTGLLIAAVLLMIAVLAVWWQRLASEPGASPRLNRVALALLFVGASLGLNRYFFMLHELWAGMLLALAFGLHRPQPGGGKWMGAWLAAALAVSLRELALPFVLLMAAYAMWRSSWREAAAWMALILVFATGLAWHLAIISAQVLPSDPLGPSWLAMRGLSGWLSNVVLSSNLRFLPHWLAGPTVILMLLGWAGWRSPAGSFGTMLFLGYGIAFMIASRPDNFYWGAMVAPAMFIGLVMTPAALCALFQAAGRPLPKWTIARKMAA